MGVGQVTVRIGMPAKIGLVFAGLFTLGLIPLIIVPIVNRTWVRTLDGEGLTVRNGARFLWTDLASVERQTVSGGLLLTAKPIRFVFRSKPKSAVSIIPRMLSNRLEVLSFLERILGAKL